MADTLNDTHDMDTIPTAPEYVFAEHLIEYLQETLPELTIHPRPWDAADQTQSIAVAAATSRGVVAVSPQPPAQLAEDNEGKTGTFRARVAVLVLVQRNVTAADAPRRAAGTLAAVLGALQSYFPKQGAGIPYAAARVDSIARLNAAEYKEFKEVAGLAVFVSLPVNYKQYLKR